MNRRELLSGLGPVAFASGCLTQGAERPFEVRRFDSFDPGTTAFENAPALAEPPRVEFAQESGLVRVDGKFFVGSSSCDRAALEGIELDRKTSTLRITVGTGSKGFLQFGCTADESADAYQLLVAFESGLPEVVTVAERGDPSGQTTTVGNPAS